MTSIGLGAKGRHRTRKKLTTWGAAAAVIAGMSVGFMASPASAAVQGGTCNAFTGASALTAAYTDSSVTVPACGPQPMYHNNTGPKVYPYPGGRYTLGYQCVEFSERYLYYKFHVTAKASANGEQVVDNYYSWYPSIFTKYSNGAVGHAPAKGDVLSFSNYSNFNGGSKGNGGHTAVVQSVSSSLASTGTGTITIVEENGGKYATNGSQVLTVSGWKVLYSPHPYVKWLHYKGSTPTPPVTTPVSSAPGVYHAGKQVSIVSQATTGVSGHSGPTNQNTKVGPNYAKNAPIWIVCYVTGQQIQGPYGTEAIWDLSDNGWYYSDAWVWTGTNGAAVPACSLKTVSTVSQATTGVNGHTGPGNQYPVAPNSNKAKGASFQIACYVDGQAINGPYGTEAIWDLAVGGWYYSDAWLWTGTNGAAVRHC
jgi:uncharacterized protein YraI